MKKKEKYKLFNFAKKQYSETFGLDLQFRRLSKKVLYELLKKYKYSSMCVWRYCCYGLYENCWQDPFEEGIWNLTQKQVNEIIENTVNKTAKVCRKDSRILYCETENRIKVIIVARDIYTEDYLITFTNEE